MIASKAEVLSTKLRSETTCCGRTHPSEKCTGSFVRAAREYRELPVANVRNATLLNRLRMRCRFENLRPFQPRGEANINHDGTQTASKIDTQTASKIDVVASAFSQRRAAAMESTRVTIAENDVVTQESVRANAHKENPGQVSVPATALFA